MPSGAYLLDVPDGATGPPAVERFSCAAGPLGWRYTAVRETADGRPLGRLDLVVDAAWRAVRLDATAGGWTLRGGAAAAELVWRRGEQEHRAPAASFTGDSPAFLVATARLLGLAVGVQRRVRLVRLGEGLAPLTVEEGWGRTPDVEEAERYEAADLATGERRVVHLVGDVVVDGTGVDLLSLTRS